MVLAPQIQMMIPLTYTWRENGIIIAGPTSDPIFLVTLSLGIHEIELTVEDGNGGSDTDEVVITIVDTTPPVISLNGGPNCFTQKPDI